MKNLIIVLLFAILGFTAFKVDVVKRSAKHVVKLSDGEGSGTGFYLKYRGKVFLISNKHVCSVAPKLNNGDTPRKVLKVSDKYDLCLLENDREDGLRLAYNILDKLDILHVIGHPMGYDLTSRSGRYVTRKTSESLEGSPDILHIAVEAFGGNSGSPLLNEYGRVVGVIFATNGYTFEDAYAVPQDHLVEFLNEFIGG